MTPGSNILAYTPTYGSRLNILATVPDLRGSAGLWFDWAVWAGAASPELAAGLDKLLNDPGHTGLQYLQIWPENRGQHHVTLEALALAQSQGYEWLLRLDDDVLHKTKRWLRKLLDRTEELRRLAHDAEYRIVSAPRIIGLNHPPAPEGQVQVGQSYQVNLMPLLGGAVRLHNLKFLHEFVPDIYAPTGRGDPQAIAVYTQNHDGLLVQFPDLRMIHKTDQLEEEDDEAMAHRRKMSRYWPWFASAPADAEATAP